MPKPSGGNSPRIRLMMDKQASQGASIKLLIMWKSGVKMVEGNHSDWYALIHWLVSLDGEVCFDNIRNGWYACMQHQQHISMDDINKAFGKILSGMWSCIIVLNFCKFSLSNTYSACCIELWCFLPFIVIQF